MIGVCLVVSNDIVHDARVLKESESLSKKYSVLVIGFGKKGKITKIHNNLSLSVIRLPELFFKIKNKLSDRQPNFRTKRYYSVIKYMLKFCFYFLYLFPALIKTSAVVYHANDLDVLFPTLLCAKLKRRKVIYDSHEYWPGLFPPGLSREIISAYEKLLVSFTDGVIGVTPFITFRFQKYPAALIYNASKTYPFPLPPSKRKNEVWYVGSFGFGRNLENLLRAAYYVPRIRFYFLGNGPLEKKLKEMKRAEKLQNVAFLKPVQPDKIPSKIRCGKLGVVLFDYTNENNFLGMPNKLFDYINAGLAVLASDFPEIKNFVLESNAGWLIKMPTTPSKIAEAIANIFKNKDALNSRIRNAIKSKKKYRWKNEETKLLNLYSCVLAKENLNIIRNRRCIIY